LHSLMDCEIFHEVCFLLKKMIKINKVSIDI